MFFTNHLQRFFLARMGAHVCAHVRSEQKRYFNYTKTMEVKTEFVEYVRKMRDTQKKYYKTKDYMVLRLSMQLERIVDKMLEEIDLPEPNEPKQLDLGL